MVSSKKKGANPLFCFRSGTLHPDGSAVLCKADQPFSPLVPFSGNNHHFLKRQPLKIKRSRQFGTVASPVSLSPDFHVLDAKADLNPSDFGGRPIAPRL